MSPAGRAVIRPAGALASRSRRAHDPSPTTQPPVTDRREHWPAARTGPRPVAARSRTGGSSRRSRTGGSIGTAARDAVRDPSPTTPPVTDRREHWPAARDGSATRRPPHSRRSRTPLASRSRRVHDPSPTTQPPVTDRREHWQAARDGSTTRRPPHSRRSRTGGSIGQPLATGPRPVAHHTAAGHGPAGALASRA
jgi:hypothetical protein